MHKRDFLKGLTCASFAPSGLPSWKPTLDADITAFREFFADCGKTMTASRLEYVYKHFNDVQGDDSIVADAIAVWKALFKCQNRQIFVITNSRINRIVQLMQGYKHGGGYGATVKLDDRVYTISFYSSKVEDHKPLGILMFILL